MPAVHDPPHRQQFSGLCGVVALHTCVVGSISQVQVDPMMADNGPTNYVHAYLPSLRRPATALTSGVR